MPTLNEIIKQVNKSNDNILTYGVEKRDYKKIPFTSPRLNYCTYGGLPRGRIIEFAGVESSGKTTTALDIVANAQIIFKKEYEEFLNKSTISKNKKEFIENDVGKKRVVYCDCENTLDVAWALKLGVDINDLIILKPHSQSAEQIFDILYNMLCTGEIGLIVIDSLGVMVSAQALEKSIEDKTYGGIAMVLTLFSKKVLPLLGKYNATLIGINQVRENLNSPYGGLVTTGGKGWKHNCSIRIMFEKGKFIDTKGNELKNSVDNPTGNLVDFSILKAKTFSSDRRRGFYTLRYDTGIDTIFDMVDVGIHLGFILQTGSYFMITDLEDTKTQGKGNFCKMLKEDTKVYKKLEKNINDYIKNN